MRSSSTTSAGAGSPKASGAPFVHDPHDGHDVVEWVPWFARSMNRFGPIGPQSDPRVAHQTIFHGQNQPSALRLTVER
jgi:hypothetical protein